MNSETYARSSKTASPRTPWVSIAERSRCFLSAGASWLTRRLFLLRLRGLLPGVFTAQNALAWFYFLTLLVPVVAVGLIGADWWSGRVARPEAAVIAAAAIVCGIISLTLVRGAPNTYLADVAAPTFVVAAWLARRIAVRAGRWCKRGSKRAGIVSLVLVTFWSVWTVGGTGSRLARAGVLDGPAGVWTQLGVVTRGLRNRPIDEWAPPGSTGLRTLTRYLHDCTAPSDRILVTWFAPDVFYYAERGFAGGQTYLHSGWHSSVADQRLTIERMQRQSVPIILGRRIDEEVLKQEFPLIYDYIQTRYRLAAESTFGGERTFLVFVDAQLAPVAEHPGLGTPCYRELVNDPADINIGPFIRVRWVQTLDYARRTKLERALGLYRAEHTEGTTWRYQVPDASPQRLRALVTHESVADTNGFDRRSLELNAPADDIARFAVQPPVYTSGWHPPEFDPTIPELTWNWTQQTATLSFANPTADAVFYLGLHCTARMSLPTSRRRLRSAPANRCWRHSKPTLTVSVSTAFFSPWRRWAPGTGSRFRSPWTERSCRQPCPREDPTGAPWGFRSIARLSYSANPHSS